MDKSASCQCLSLVKGSIPNPGVILGKTPAGRGKKFSVFPMEQPCKMWGWNQVGVTDSPTKAQRDFFNGWDFPPGIWGRSVANFYGRAGSCSSLLNTPLISTRTVGVFGWNPVWGLFVCSRARRAKPPPEQAQGCSDPGDSGDGVFFCSSAGWKGSLYKRINLFQWVSAKSLSGGKRIEPQGEKSPFPGWQKSYARSKGKKKMCSNTESSWKQEK